MFRRFIDAQIDRVRSCPQAGMLGEKVLERVESSLRRTVDLVTGSTVRHLVSQVEADNPFAATLPALLTEEEKNKALAQVRRQLDSGAMSLPGPLVDCLSLQLEDTTDAFLEALSRAEDDHDAICAELLGGRPYHTIDDVTFSAGDTHNHGRSVTVLHTNAGKVVYKPHDLRIDGHLFLFAKEFFDEFVGIPRSIAPCDRYGFCEFVEKRRAQGEEEARRFWYALGGLTAFAKLLGSRDLHYENILCHGVKPYVVDIETLLSPVSSELARYARSPEGKRDALHSPGFSLLMPSRIEGMEFSALMNVSEEGVAPIVDGSKVTVRPYLSAFEEGYHTAYARTVKHRERIAQALGSFPTDLTVRVVQRPTRGYWEMLKKLYHHSALASEESRRQNGETLARLLRDCDTTMQAAVIDSEVRQMQRGDVPYFYTHVDSLSLYGEGKELVRDKFGVSALGHALDILSAMGEADELFDLTFIDHAIRQYPDTTPARPRVSSPTYWQKETQREAPLSERAATEEAAPLSVQAATEEAARILEEVCSSHIPAPDGGMLWGYVGNADDGLSLCDHSLFNGLTGVAVFASACASVCDDELVRKRADDLVGLAAEEIGGLLSRIRSHESTWSEAPATGEGSGLAGILTGIALMGRHPSGERLGTTLRDLLALLDETDFANCTMADRIGGLAGLVSALCRFEEYRGRRSVIRAAADRLLELKDFAYRDAVLWKTLQAIPRHLSGAGHGMAGIAEALFSAARVLDDDHYLPAALEALEYERKVYLRYSAKLGTWADLRDFPPNKYMHGYCSGAPGIGVMLARISEESDGGGIVRELAGYAHKSVDSLPLNELDHLCCGNAAVAEYYLTVGDRESAGRVLGAMRERARREGGYRDLSHRGSGVASASLFNGVCGIGYEMLRYAHPDKISSLL